MNLLVVGSGGREHAIVWKLRQSPRVDKLFVAPGNAGTASIATNLNIPSSDFEKLAEAAKAHSVDLTVVGPEAPLAQGIVDHFQEKGLRIFGPTRAAAQIESSKVFAKRLMEKYSIPTASAKPFSSYAEAKRYVQKARPPLVVKADGLAAGKGVVVCRSREEAVKALYDCLEAKSFGGAGERVLVEEMLTGPEVSVFAFTDGSHISPLVAACDYKRLLDGDRGPNTGGMGSYSPPEFWSHSLAKDVLHNVMEPTVRGMAAEGYPYRGVLYAGLMVTKDGPKVLEFNCRLGDPETQVILPRLASDLLDVMLAVTEGRLEECPMEWSHQACVGTVLASAGYPGSFRKGYPIYGLEDVPPEVIVFHAGTRLYHNEISGRTQVVSEGGRVLTVAALGASLEEARGKVYNSLRRIRFEDMYYRKDVAAVSTTRP